MSRIIANNIRHNDATVDSITLDSAGNVSVPNDLAVDTDTLFVDVSTDRVGINTTSPDYTVDINGELGITEGQPITWHNGSGSLSGQIFCTSGDEMVFRNTSVGLERMRILAGGGLSITNGNLILSSGSGIDFSANGNAGGMTSELLDDYEEGTFTPTITGSTSAGTTTYVTQQGTYTKIGRQVTIACAVHYTAATGSGLLRFSGLPFAALTSHTLGYQGAAEVAALNWTGGTYIVAQLEPGDGNVYLVGDTDDGDRTYTSISNEAAVLRFVMTYFV